MTGTIAAKPHPFDFDKLEKGSWIEAEELEDAARCKRTHASFGLRVLGLREMIESRTGILSRAEGYRLRLMTDSEALVWTIRQAGDASRKMERNATRLSENIDTGKLSAPEQVMHEHAGRAVSAMAMAQKAEREKNQKLFAFAYRGELPGSSDSEDGPAELSDPDHPAPPDAEERGGHAVDEDDGGPGSGGGGSEPGQR